MNRYENVQLIARTAVGGCYRPPASDDQLRVDAPEVDLFLKEGEHLLLVCQVVVQSAFTVFLIRVEKKSQN